jgi:hypothetical protein
LFSLPWHLVLACFPFSWVRPFFQTNDDPEYLSRVGQQIENLTSATDQMLSMFLTIEIGLFVIIGFSVRSISNTPFVAVSQTVVLFGFLISVFTSSYFGYLARLQVIDLVNAVQLDFSNVEITIARQALSLGLAGVFATTAAALSILDRH